MAWGTHGPRCFESNLRVFDSLCQEPCMLTIEEILATLPHRPPFLLIDRILEIEDGARAVGIKNVTMNEPFFVGHFPGRPVMPGVLIIEALAQVGAVAILRVPEFAGKLVFFAG